MSCTMLRERVDVWSDAGDSCQCQCVSVCQCCRSSSSSRSSPQPSADLSSTETSWQACRLFVTAKAPFSPCRRNSSRKQDHTSTQEIWLRLFTCMWRWQTRTSNRTVQSAPRHLEGTQDSSSQDAPSQCSAIYTIMTSGWQSHWRCLEVLLFDDAALLFNRLFIAVHFMVTYWLHMEPESTGFLHSLLIFTSGHKKEGHKMRWEKRCEKWLFFSVALRLVGFWKKKN